MSLENPDVKLRGVKSPAGYGKLVAVVPLEGGNRELWFQHDSEPLVRMVVMNVDAKKQAPGRAIDVRTKGTGG